MTAHGARPAPSTTSPSDEAKDGAMNATRGRLLHAAVGAAALLGMLSRADAANAPAEGAPTAQTVKLPSGPGSIRGLADDPSVSEFTGQASYRVPLKLP